MVITSLLCGVSIVHKQKSGISRCETIDTALKIFILFFAVIKLCLEPANFLFIVICAVYLKTAKDYCCEKSAEH